MTTDKTNAQDKPQIASAAPMEPEPEDTYDDLCTRLLDLAAQGIEADYHVLITTGVGVPARGFLVLVPMGTHEGKTEIGIRVRPIPCEQSAA